MQWPNLSSNPDSQSSTAFVTSGMLCVLAFTFLFASYGLFFEPVSYLDALGLVPDLQPSILNAYRFVTYALIHFDPGHFALNALCLMAFGALVEPKMPWTSYVLFLTTSAAVAGIAHMAVYQESVHSLLGSSGVAAGLCGMFIGLRFTGPFWGAFPYASSMVIGAVLLSVAIVGNLELPKLGDSSHVAHFAGIAWGLFWSGHVRAQLDKVERGNQ